ncbi:hypothetical protein MPSEU_000746700 [Mayamaea pseudoterrestris]|nr:hypothetical protein MPSEU_000746700 [Mayamaea pseudoterrestris]
MSAHNFKHSLASNGQFEDYDDDQSSSGFSAGDSPLALPSRMNHLNQTFNRNSNNINSNGDDGSDSSAISICGDIKDEDLIDAAAHAPPQVVTSSFFATRAEPMNSESEVMDDEYPATMDPMAGVAQVEATRTSAAKRKEAPMAANTTAYKRLSSRKTMVSSPMNVAQAAANPKMGAATKQAFSKGTASAKVSARQARGEPKDADDDLLVDMHHVRVGSLVYCVWDRDEHKGRYYWGEVTEKRHVGRSVFVSVEFEDGDRRHDVPRKDYYTATHLIKHFPNENLAYLGALQGLLDRGLLKQDEAASMSPTQRCGSCYFCTAAPCARCYGCREGPSCIQTMCQKIPLESKALAAKGFPKGWRFAFHKMARPEHQAPYIVLLAPNGVRRYISFENAINHSRKQLEHVDVVAFYTHAGVEQKKQVGFRSSPGRRLKHNQDAVSGSGSALKYTGTRNERSGASDVLCPTQHDALADANESALCKTFNYIEYIRLLKNGSCGICAMCDKDDCGACLMCKTNTKDVVCLHKLCSRMQAKLPLRWPGWTLTVVACTDRDECDSSHAKLDSVSLRFFSPGGRVYGWKTFPMFTQKNDAAPEMTDVLNDFFGLAYMQKLDKHPLLGKDYRHDWWDANNRPCSVEGTISACYVAGGVERFTVCLNESSVNRLKSEAVDRRTPITTLCNLDYSDTVGGYLGYCHSYSMTNTEKFHDDYAIWRVPSTVRAQLGANGLPSRTLSYNGWELTFFVTQSAINHVEANLGCFLVCKSASRSTKNSKCFKLSPGVFLDIGVYGRPEDYMPHQQFRCKNSIHNFKADTYAFGVLDEDGSDFIDIGDNVRTGQLKETARCNILPFVNETDGIEIPCVIARRDPAGQMHYLLGHFRQEFVLKVDKPIEIKIDYGADYEKVRVKNNYPRVNGAELKRLQTEIKAEIPIFIEDLIDAPLCIVADNVAFLETFANEQYERKIMASDSERQRALLFAVLSVKRMEFITSAFKNTKMDQTGKVAYDKRVADASLTKEKAQRVMSRLMHLADKSFIKGMFANDAFRKTLQEQLGVWSGDDVYACLNDMCVLENPNDPISV